MFNGATLIPWGIKLYVQKVSIDTFGYRHWYLWVSNFMFKGSTLIP